MKKTVLKDKGSPEIYINEETGKGLIRTSARTIRCGSIKIVGGRYKYFQYRDGKKVIQKYLGKL